MEQFFRAQFTLPEVPQLNRDRAGSHAQARAIDPSTVLRVTSA